MKLKQALDGARELLQTNNIEDASLEAEILLRHVLGINRAQLFLEYELELNSEQKQAFDRLIERRLSGEPSAYITGHREFYGLDFAVDHRVLIPRPESELLVEKAIEIAQHQSVNTIADIGTGSGAIAVSVAVNIPGVKIYATDISTNALEVARAIREAGISPSAEQPDESDGSAKGGFRATALPRRSYRITGASRAGRTISLGITPCAGTLMTVYTSIFCAGFIIIDTALWSLVSPST